MANEQNTINTVVQLDASQAQQEIVKLNAAASDSTKTLTERVEAKNKAVELQEKLSRDNIDALEKERDALIKNGASLKDVEKAQKKINAERLKATKLSENNAKQQAKLSEALADSKNSVKQLDDASGGLLGKFKALATNPIGLVIAALAATFKLVSEAIGRSEKASESFGKIGAKLSGLFNGLIAVITPVVELLGEALVFAIEKPKEAWESFIGALESGYNFVKAQIIDRFSANFDIFTGKFQQGVLKMRIAWNEWTGDSEEAEKLTKELDLVNEKVSNATELLKQKNAEIVSVFNNAVDSVKDFAKTAVDEYNKAAQASENLANAERSLVRNRIALEKQQLTSLRLAEEQRQIRDDESRSIEDRIKANQKLGEILDEQLKKELALAQQNLNYARLQAQASGNTIENIEAIGDAEIKLLEIQERITGQRSEQLVNENSLLKEKADLKKADEEAAEKKAQKEEEDRLAKQEKEEAERLRQQELQNELDELGIERLRNKGEKTLDLELELLERKRLQDVSAKDLTEKDIQLINERAAFEKQKIKDAEEKANKEKEKALLDQTINGAAEAFGIAQEVAVAKMIMAAPEAISGSFKEAAKNYAPPLSLVMGALGAAGTVAPIIKGLSDIKKARFSKGGKSSSSGAVSSATISSSTSGASGGAAIPATAATEVINDLSANNAARLGADVGLGSSSSSTAASNITGRTSGNVIFSESQYRNFQDQVQFREEKTTIRG